MIRSRFRCTSVEAAEAKFSCSTSCKTCPWSCSVMSIRSWISEADRVCLKILAKINRKLNFVISKSAKTIFYFKAKKERRVMKRTKSLTILKLSPPVIWSSWLIRLMMSSGVGQQVISSCKNRTRCSGSWKNARTNVFVKLSTSSAIRSLFTAWMPLHPVLVGTGTFVMHTKIESLHSTSFSMLPKTLTSSGTNAFNSLPWCAVRVANSRSKTIRADDSAHKVLLTLIALLIAICDNRKRSQIKLKQNVINFLIFFCQVPQICDCLRNQGSLQSRT